MTSLSIFPFSQGFTRIVHDAYLRDRWLKYMEGYDECHRLMAQGAYPRSLTRSVAKKWGQLDTKQLSPTCMAARRLGLGDQHA